MYNIKPCWTDNYHFLTCKDPDKCKEEGERLPACTLNNYEGLGKRGKKLLKEDALEKGLYMIADLRDHEDYLKNNSGNIKIGERNENMKKLRKRHGGINPLDVDPDDYNLREREYHIRASEFTNSCHIARLISKFDKEKLKEALKAEDIELDKKLAEAGTALHKVSQGDMNQKHVELPVWLEHEGYIISGHVDAAYVTEKERIPFIIDLKRSIKPAKSYDDQAFCYLEALNQRLNLNAEYGISDLIAHASFDDTMKKPRHHLSLLYLTQSKEKDRDKESKKRIKRVFEDLEKNVKIQKEILNKDKFSTIRTETCESCFPSTRKICEFLEGKNLREFMDDKVIL